MTPSRGCGPAGPATKLRQPWPSLVVVMLAIGFSVAHAQQPATPQAAQAEQHPAPPPPANIVFVDAAAVTLAPDSSGSFKLDTALKNSGGNPGTPSFNLRCVETTPCDKKTLTPKPAIGSMPANTTEIAHFSLTGIELPATYYIELVTTEGEGKASKITNTSLKQIKLTQKYATWDVILAFAACLIASMSVMIATRIAVYLKLGLLPKGFKVGGPAWEFTKSWSSTLTFAGATVTAALALGALPELTKNASRNGYAIMALWIALIVVIAPLSFVILRNGSIVKDKKTEEEGVEYTGGILAFFSSCALTLFSGLAQLLVLFLLGDELFRGYGAWSWRLVDHDPWWIGTGSILILVAAAMLCVHTLVSARLTIELELADRTENALNMVGAAAEAKVGDLKGNLEKMTVGPDDKAIAELEERGKQAADCLDWARNTFLGIRNDRALPWNYQATLKKAAKHLNVALPPAVSPRPHRSWPVL